LGCECRFDRVLRAREDGKEGIALGVDLASAGAGEGIAQELLMVGKHLAVAIAKPGEKPRRPFYVRKEEREGAAW
jgi:hypothetical protein